MAKWVEIRKGADFQAIAGKYDITPFTARLIRNKDLVDEKEIQEYLHGSVKDLHPAARMKGMAEAVSILSGKIRQGKRIRIIGDYDIDGVCSAYILLKGLSALGAKADTDIPDRVKDGYGLNRRLVEAAHQDGVDTILTCDNGIAAVEEIALAKELGLTVVVTDHHEVQEQLPPADVIVNPHQALCPYPYKKLCGAAVAWKLIGALWEAFGYREEELYAELLMFAGFATVGDVVDLTGENRILVREALRLLQRTTHPGMSALMEATELTGKKISAFHIGFVLGPCINASGRLETAKKALELLNTDDRELARTRALELKSLNDERKGMTERGVEMAVEQIENSSLKNDRVLVVYLPDCHESIAGIVAGRIRERYYRPVFVLTRSEDGVKGSGRSIESYSMFEEVSKCKELFSKYGGHPMAAGLSLPEENVAPFREKINELCTLTADELTAVVHIDMALPFRCVSERLVEELELLEPFGKGNEKPIFAARSAELLEARVLGKNRNFLRMKLRDDSGASLTATYFGDDVEEVLDAWRENPHMHILYYPEINEYRGTRSLQIRLKAYCPAVSK